MQKITIFLLLFFIVFGCSTKQSPLITADSILGNNEKTKKSYNINTSWWTEFNDQQLNRLVAIAIGNNAELIISGINIKKILYQANLLRSNLLPNLSASGSLGIKKNENQDNEESRTYTSEGAINYEIDIWRKISDSSIAGKFEYYATVEDYHAVRLTIINSVIDSYFYISYLKSAINVINKKIEYYDKLVKKTQIKLNLGKISSFDLQKSMQSLFSAKQTFFTLQQEMEDVQKNLRNFLNIKPDELNWIDFPDVLSCKTIEVNLNAPLSVLANRPDVKAAEFRLKKAFYDSCAAEKELYPSITVDFGITSSSQNIHNSLNFPIYMANIKINLPFLNWNKIKWNIKISESDYNITRIMFESTIQTALNEVTTAFINYKNALECYKNSLDQHNVDVKIENYYKLRYENGSNDITDWLSAAATSTDTDLNILRNYYEVIKYEVMIFKAMAGKYSI